MGFEQTKQIDSAVAEDILAVVDGIHGQEVVDDLLELAAIGGEQLEATPDHPLHIATNRMALTSADHAGRAYVRSRMDEAGMDVFDDHPLALIGLYAGQHEDLDPVVALSHTDTVPNGDIYDGTLGVLSAVKAVKTMNELEIRGERDIMVVSLSIEESSRFGSALMGSRALFHGLSERELDIRKGDDQSIREALGEKGARRASEPEFGPLGHMQPKPYAAVELHVEQDKKLIDRGIDLGVVHTIATPIRYEAKVGEKALQPDIASYDHEQYFRLSVKGYAGHSGATPMGSAHRADGLVETAEILGGLLEEQDDEGVFAIGHIEVEKAAMNKIPGMTHATLRLASDSERSVERMRNQLLAALEQRAKRHDHSTSSFPAEPFRLEPIARSEAGTFFEVDEMTARQQAALKLVTSVNEAALANADDDVVGTVASYTTSDDGIVFLEVDIRGIDLDSRDRTVERVRSDLLARNMSRIILGEPLAGSGHPPDELDGSLVSEAIDTITRFEIGTVKPMFSAAGHDTQNAVRAGIPSVMIFAQSKDGKAHNPEAFTSTVNIEKAARAQAALLLRLAHDVPEIF